MAIGGASSWGMRKVTEATRIDIVFGHYNPVGHQLVDAPCNWPYSSFRRYVEQGVHPNDWGADREITFQDTVG
jgi:hypothetical protein